MFVLFIWLCWIFMFSINTCPSNLLHFVTDRRLIKQVFFCRKPQGCDLVRSSNISSIRSGKGILEGWKMAAHIFTAALSLLPWIPLQKRIGHLLGIERFYKSWALIFIVGSWPQWKAWNYGMSAKQKVLKDQQKLKTYFKYQANLRLIFKPHLVSPWELWLTRVGNTGFPLKLLSFIFAAFIFAALAMCVHFFTHQIRSDDSYWVNHRT